MNELLLMLLGGVIGKALGEKGVPSDADVVNVLRSLKPTMSMTISLDITQTRDNEVHDDAGYAIFVQNPEDASVPVYIKLNEEESDLIDITENRKIVAPFYRFFVTNASGTGTLILKISKSPIFAIAEAITKIDVTGSNIMLPVDIQAQYVTLDANMKKWGGTTLTGADITAYLAKLVKHQYETPVNSGVNVGVASTLVLAANSDRKYASFINDSDENIWLGIGAAAVAHAGKRLNAYGGSYEINWTNLYAGAIYGIHEGTGNKVVCVEEGD